ncbi:hypothetical protein DFS33DRAFT_1278921 [Desarmillaria ectypa]|nr:hypothetical protein DFS33DRAFT_1278921 [Desarmillaria ectypa]
MSRQQMEMQPFKARGNSFSVYLHRRLGDKRSTIPVRATVPFISSDPIDRALGLPGVSISRLLGQEPDILVNANSFIPYPPPGFKVEISVVGYEGADEFFIPLECTHASITHLGVARILARAFREFINRSPQPNPVNETNIRLVALYEGHDSKDRHWNVAYAVVNT